MTNQKNGWENVVDELKERAKELNCLYSIEELLNDRKMEIEEAFQRAMIRDLLGSLSPDPKFIPLDRQIIFKDNLCFLPGGALSLKAFKTQRLYIINGNLGGLHLDPPDGIVKMAGNRFP